MKKFGFVLSCLSGVLLVVLIAFFTGAAAQRYFPRSAAGQIFNSLEAALLLDRSSSPKNFRRWYGGVSKDNTNFRWTSKRPGFAGPILVSGGLYQFLEICPGQGCLAVEFGADGKVKRSWPFRPDELFKGEHESVTYGKGRKFDWYPFGLQQIDSGELIVVPSTRNSFPSEVGIMRVRRDGMPVWRKFDGSHHWPRIVRKGEIIVTARFAEEEPPSLFRRRCTTSGLHDVVRFLDYDGNVKDEIHVLEAFRNSRFRGLMDDTTDPCAPLHVNYIDVATQHTANVVDGIEAGDLLLSMRNISAIAILGTKTRKLKRVVRGTFVQQHSARFLHDGRVVLFDNMGGSKEHRGSRILALDLNKGTETNIYPRSLDGSSLDSFYAGLIDISADGKRLLITETHAGRILELDLESGFVINTYTNLHQLETSPIRRDATESVGLFEVFSAYYAHGSNASTPGE